jgi:haloalkane dehalogenase
MVQDWGGPIGLAVAIRHPERVAAVVIANTFAWPKTDTATRLFSRIMGGPIGSYLVLWRNAFVEWILPGNVRRTKLPPRVMAAYRGPFPTPGSRWPTQVFPRELIASRAFLAEVERGLGALADRPALIVWPTRDPAFRRAERRRFERAFPTHHTVLVRGAGHYVQEDAPREIVAAVRAWRPVSPG